MRNVFIGMFNTFTKLLSDTWMSQKLVRILIYDDFTKQVSDKNLWRNEHLYQSNCYVLFHYTTLKYWQMWSNKGGVDKHTLLRWFSSLVFGINLMVGPWRQFSITFDSSLKGNVSPRWDGRTQVQEFCSSILARILHFLHLDQKQEK